MLRATLLLALGCVSSAFAGPPFRPFPQHTKYAADTILPTHRTRTQLDADVRARYELWKTQYLREAGRDALGRALFRVSFGKTNPGRTVSEGQGFGMVILALIAGHDPAAQEIFDGLWRFARMHPSIADSRLMAWEVPPADGGAAFDGDADMAYALLLADTQWGSHGAIAYRCEAERVITAIREAMIGPDSHLPMLGDWVPVHGREKNQYTVRTSDFMPAHFRAYRAATNDAVWDSVVARTKDVIESLQADYSRGTGLVPDFVVPVSATDRTPRPAPPHFLEAFTDGSYSYNAGRVPWRLGIAAALSGDPQLRRQAVRIARWARDATKGDPRLVRGGYELDGTPTRDRDYFTSFFVSPLGVAAMNDPSLQSWLNAIYEVVRTTDEDYYEDTVTLLCMFAMTGNAWEPIAGRGGWSLDIESAGWLVTSSRDSD